MALRFRADTFEGARSGTEKEKLAPVKRLIQSDGNKLITKQQTSPFFAQSRFNDVLC